LKIQTPRVPVDVERVLTFNVMKPWTREDTQEWISQVENRIEDIDHYLKKTLEWCEINDIHDDRRVFALNFLTCIWVSHMREEIITYREMMELLGLESIAFDEDKIYDLGPRFKNLDHEEMLEIMSREFDPDL
jgi:hypothetical protein